ncbi:MAG: CxxxxCH/CxxCH domain-containing protein [Geobacteraceae bacterium]|nr:CxxxxCH/CxxCH domain-containing protein [Geobacteraceae bacterium]
MEKMFWFKLKRIFQHFRIGITLLVCLAAMAFTTHEASASVDFVNQWPVTPAIVSNSSASPASGIYKIGAGVNRLLVVAVATEYSSAQSPTITVTYGGQTINTVNSGIIVNNTTGNNKIWIGYLNEAGIVAAGSNKTLTVAPSTNTNLVSIYATAAVFNGVDQTTPISNSGSLGTTVNATTIGPVAFTAGNTNTKAGNTGMSIYFVNWNNNSGETTASTGYTGLRNYVGTNMALSGAYKVVSSASAESVTSTTTATNIGALAGFGINPVTNAGTNYNKITTCGDCHGNPPEDGTARNVPPGLFVGSHEKHTGGDDLQYGMACTACHSNNTTLNHANGRIKVAGSNLPNTAYTNTSSIAVRNTFTLGYCNNIYCHSTGRSTPQYTNPQWGSATGNCLACHAGRNSGGTMVTSNSGFKLSTTHMQHMQAPYTATNINCNICHSKTVTDHQTLKSYTGITYHANGTPDVKFTNIAYASYTSYKANKTCTNVSCHGGKTKSAWSATSINKDNTCLHCHGYGAGTGTALRADKYNAAPGWITGGNTGISTDGNIVSTDPRVGGHFKHLSSVSTKKMKCNECHLVPSNPYDAGHTDSPRYSSNTIVFTQASTANKNTTSPAYTVGGPSTAATCTTTYCHGSKMPKGDTSGSNRSPQWTQTLNCGSCHGNPPTFGSSSSAHVGSVATTSCIGCHKTVTDATGKIINKALHLDGLVSVLVDTSVTGACNKCHGNPPQTLTYGRYSGLVKPATLIMGSTPAGAGAHLKHQNNGMTCNTCHNSFSAATHPDNKLQIFFRISSNTHTGWNTTSPRAPYGTYSGNSSGNAPVDTSVATTLVRGTAGGLNSCNVYCHGAWNGSSKTSNPRWTGTATCGSCHGATVAAPPQVGTHARHAGYSSSVTARQGYSFSCNKCHPNRGTNDHVKGAVHVRFSTAVLGTSASYILPGASLSTPAGSRLYLTNKLAGTLPDGSCSNISCHSNGRGANMGTFRNATTLPWGTTTRNCLSCHGGRTAGTGAPARSSKGFTLSTTHYQHLKYPAANINCVTCHSKTSSTTDPLALKNFTGVKRHANGVRDVTFASTLPYGTYTSYKSPESGSTGTSKTCSNVSCHGGKTRNPWSATTTNNDNTCLHCHGLGTGLGTALRADKYNAAPGWNGGISTDGNNVATDIRVGAHFKHLSSIYVKKIKCNECHAVPTTPFEGTHMATQRYNSQTLAFGQASTATKNTTTPTFTAGTAVAPASCTTYCHGTNLKNGDSTVGTVRTPTWNQDLTTGGNCGKCHGNPPNSVSGSHASATPTTGCGGCHSMVVNGSGTIINKNLHMNGIVEFVSSCNACHSYLPTDTWTSSYAVEGASFNAHSKHINYLLARNTGVSLNKDTDTFGGATFQVICGVCHTWDPAQHSTGGGGSRLINFGTNSTSRQYGASHPKYNGTSGQSSSVSPKSCSNIDCHYRTSPVWSTY